ncbi:MAG: hypothetical protein IH957_05320 [Chloroflexi bacterium]|nr:hypothetical protein [Chloroflexota bacterium]
MLKSTDVDAGQDDVMAQRLHEQALDLWVEPELARRRSGGLMGSEFELRALQVVMIPPPNERIIIRLNEEVAPIARYRVDGPVKEGQRIEIDPSRVQGFSLGPEDDPNAGHFTMMRLAESWLIHFDFTYNRQRAQEYLKAAREYLRSAGLVLRDEGALRSASELLFAAIELSVQAELMHTPRGETKRHRERLKRFVNWSELGNAPDASREALTKLTNLRPASRYLEAPLEIDPQTLEYYASAIEEQIAHVDARLGFVPAVNDQKKE